VGVHGPIQFSPQVISGIRARHPALRLLVLFGSRARGDARGESDWDLGYLAEASLDPDALLLDVVRALGTDRVDLVDLARAGGQVRFRAAGEGRVLHEADRGVFAKFWLEAVDFWCDAEPLLRAGYAQVLSRLRR
jgi:predicted nucleotidyltransferase